MRILPILLLLLAYVEPMAAQASSGDHAERAAQLVQRGELKRAEMELREALQSRPNDPEFLTSLGGVLGMEGHLVEANSFLARAVKLKPEDPLLQRNLAANEWQLGRFAEAQSDLEKVLRNNADDKGAIFLLGMVSENERNYTRSIALLESVPELAERQPEVYVALASSYYHTNQRSNAQSALKKLLNRPAPLQVMLLGARVATNARDYPVALQIATLASGSFPRSYQVLLAKASIEIKLSYFSQAVRSARTAVDLHVSVETRRELAFAQWHAGLRQDAVSGFEDLLRQFPSDAGAYETYGGLLLEEGPPESRTRAVQLLKRALVLDDSSFEAHYELGNAELSAGQLEEARRDLERAVQIDPSDSRAHYAMSRLYRRLGQTSEADRESTLYQQAKVAQN